MGSVAPAHMIHSRATGRNLLARGPFGQGGQDSEQPRMGRIEVDLLIAGTGGSIYFQATRRTPSGFW